MEQLILQSFTDILDKIVSISEFIGVIAGIIAGYFGGKKHQQSKDKNALKKIVELEVIDELDKLEKYKRQQDGL